MFFPEHEPKRARSSWKASLRALVSGILVVGMAFLGPMEGQMRAADQPPVETPIAQLAPAPVFSVDVSPLAAQTMPASRWLRASRDTEQPRFLISLLNPVETALPLSLPAPQSASPSNAPPPSPAPAPSSSKRRSDRKRWLAVGIAGAATAAIFGSLIPSCHRITTNEVCEVRYALTAVGAGTAGLGFVMAFRH